MRNALSIVSVLTCSSFAFFACTSTDSAKAPDTPAPDAGTDTGAAGECPAKDPATWLAKPGTEHDADLETSETWTAAASPHRLPRGLSVGASATLTIEPCAIVVTGDAQFFHIGAAAPTEAKADLVAVGSADKPILFRGTSATNGSWEGLTFFGTNGKSRLSYVTVENAGGAPESGGVSLHSAMWINNGATVVVDHSTFRGGAMDGVRLDDGGAFGPASEGNTITGMAGVAIRADFNAVGSILDGKYTGNGVDRVELYPDLGPTAPATWHKLSVPWHFRGFQADVSVPLTIEPGTHVIVERLPGDGKAFEGTLRILKGGSLIADGKSEAGRIVFEGEANDPPGSWHGFEFTKEANKSTLAFVTIAKAGRMFQTASSHCEDPSVERVDSAIKLEAKGLVTISNTEVRDVGDKAYAIDRDYCDGALGEFKGAGNTFTGAILCGETDTLPCNPQPACDPVKTCCDHDYVCGAPKTP